MWQLGKPADNLQPQIIQSAHTKPVYILHVNQLVEMTGDAFAVLHSPHRCRCCETSWTVWRLKTTQLRQNLAGNHEHEIQGGDP